MLNPKPAGASGNSFKYEAFWEDHVDCRQIVSTSWAGTNDENVGWASLNSKLKKCKHHLSQWHKQTFKNAAKEIKNKKSRQYLLNLSHDQVDWNEVKMLRREVFFFFDKQY